MFSGRWLLCGLLAVTSANDHCGHGSSRVVPGRAFDRIATIWLENNDFQVALDDPNLGALAKQGILLENYFSTTHPSEPNYVASAGGDNFGMDNDDLNEIPANVSSVADLLEFRDISWAEYQQGLPFTGFTGFDKLAASGANDYVRKHNPLVIYNSTADVPARLAKIKNFTLFKEDLDNDNLPQWMFITPNMTNDGHDTNVTFAGSFIKDFLPPLLANPKFNTPGTLVILTFDENLSENLPNRVYAVLLGNAVPKHLIGTTDSAFYTHYSLISTVSANWDLPTLGRYDVGSNVFSFVAEQTHDEIQSLPSPGISGVLLNASYPGLFNSVTKIPLPIPNTKLVVNGRPVLPKVVETWGCPELQKCTVYTGSLVIPSGENPPVIPKGCT